MFAHSRVMVWKDCTVNQAHQHRLRVNFCVLVSIKNAYALSHVLLKKKKFSLTGRLGGGLEMRTGG